MTQRILVKEIVNNKDKEVLLAGWVDSRRDHGKLIFLDLRDKTGIAQLVISEKSDPQIYKLASQIRDEWVLQIGGIVKERPGNMKNPDLETGNFEIPVTKLLILNEAKTMPFPINTEGYDIEEELRLKYRYLDLRRSRLQKNIGLRSKFVQTAREFLFKKDFTEIETPMLTKS